MAITLYGSGNAIVQVVSSSTTQSTTNTTSTLADVSGMTATITPKSASNKILVMMSTQYELFRSAIETAAYMVVQRNGTTIISQSANSLALEAGVSSGSRIYFDGMYSIQYLDSPNTTSAVTYKLQFACTSTGSNGRITVNNQGNNTQTSMVVLLEVAA
jgi:hypothetical protein